MDLSYVLTAAGLYGPFKQQFQLIISDFVTQKNVNLTPNEARASQVGLQPIFIYLGIRGLYIPQIWILQGTDL